MPLIAPSLQLEYTLREQGYAAVAGVDEVGRGCLAGPVVSAAVILPLHLADLPLRLEGVRDSKQLTALQRGHAFRAILAASVSVGVGWASHHVIDRHGITFANRRAMVRAIAALPVPADYLLLDYLRLPEVNLPQHALPHGEDASLSIAAASIVAKVLRDRWMASYDRRCPGYGFARHKGYGTPAHRAAIERLGPAPIHRRSFAPFRP